jgi:DNA-directed RNA polymerase
MVKIRELEKIMDTAGRMRKFKQIWFPHNLDFRSRIYPISDYLTPQGTDVARALLLFAQGKPLGEEGVFWLAVTGAGLMDVDPETGLKLSSLSLNERALWTLSHGNLMERVAEDPWKMIKWWTVAEKPLQFFAFCIEWAGYLREGPGYVCGLPCSQDGCANGLQHLSAMWRDPELAKQVAMCPSETPVDQYQLITATVMELLVEEAHTQDDEQKRELAARWLHSGLVDRALVKRPTMTFGYGATRFGYGDQLFEHLHTKKLLAKIGRTRAERTAACSYLARIIWEALQKALKSAHEAMEWMRACARMICYESNNPIRWHTPCGFPVYMNYFKTARYRVETILAGQVVKPSIYSLADETDSLKSANAISPNVVHGCDAAALQKTICLARRRGITSFGTVHDSYSTVPADVGRLGDATREAFVGLYQQWDVVHQLDRELREQYRGKKDLPQPPPKGSFNIAEVLEAPYFFS